MIPYLGLLASNALGQTGWRRDSWVATDALGRKLPIGGEVPVPRKDRFVGIFYFVWHGHHGMPGPLDITKILAKGDAEKGFGDVGAFHWWGEPEAGYFQSKDPWIARRNLELLGNAGVDCLFVDVTNAFTYHDEVKLLFDTAAQMRAEGNPTPQIAFVLNAGVVRTLKELWKDWYQPKYRPELWFQWLGKPIILADPDAKDETTGEPIPPEIKSFFTWRRSWFETDPKGWFGDGKDKWPWRDRTPQNFGWHDDPKTPEQIAVGVASHPIGMNIGRSYKNGAEPDVDAKGMTKTYDQGIQFQEQWDRALAIDPKLIFVTGWNEWVAQRFKVAHGQQMNLAKRELKEGETYFVDLYNAEFSRDIDPMKGGYTDNYYYQLIANIRWYKGAQRLPAASKPKTINFRKGFNQWKDVQPEFRDNVGDTLHRDFDGWGSLHYKDDSGRNDIALAKVARDHNNLYFYAQTVDPLTPSSDPNWMVLLLDTDQNASTGLHGYDYRVGSGLLEKWSNGSWNSVAKLQINVTGNELQMLVPRKLVGYRGALDFKWADNCGDDGLFLGGDAAPPRRFNFRFQG